MIEIRGHGRGGQGIVTFAEILAKAGGSEGKYVQAFPAFTPERTGAPVRAFCRISDEPITIRSQIYNPDYIVILDSSLLDLPEVTEGLKPETIIIVNSETKPDLKIKNKIYNIDVTKTAVEVLGKPIVNTAMLGAFTKVSGLAKLESVQKALDEKFPPKLSEPNKKLVEMIYNQTDKDF